MSSPLGLIENHHYHIVIWFQFSSP